MGKYGDLIMVGLSNSLDPADDGYEEGVDDGYSGALLDFQDVLEDESDIQVARDWVNGLLSLVG